MDISEEDKKIIVDRYIAFHNETMKQFRDEKLSPEKIYAIGQYVLDRLFQKAFDHSGTEAKERVSFKENIENILREECPGLLFKTSLVFRPKVGFFKKDEYDGV